MFLFIGIFMGEFFLLPLNYNSALLHQVQNSRKVLNELQIYVHLIQIFY